MLEQKEQGYDEYLAEKVQRGLDDFQQGRVMSLEEADQHWQATIDKLAEQEQKFEEKVAYA